MRLSLFTGVLFTVFSLSLSHGQEKAGTSLFKALGSLVRSNKEKCEESKEQVPMPQNSLTSPSDAMTPMGNRLQPFGQPGYWGGNATVSTEEDELAVLPPLPDLRTPDQITKVERKRNFRNAKFATRQAGNEAAAETRRMADLAEIETPQADPSTALIQVESAKPGAQDYGRRERPDTVNGGNLKPFNAESTYIEGCEVKFKWSDHQFVENQPNPAEDELGMLPPLPDLRTPDQVTTSERMRNLRNLKFMGRQAKQEAARREADEAARRTLDPF